MSFALWFILLGAISLGIGSFIGPWMERPLFRILWAPGILICAACRYAGARMAGLPVSQVKLFRGEGRGVRVDISGGNAIKTLVLGLFSYVGPLFVILVINHMIGSPLRLGRELPPLHLDSRAVMQLGEQAGGYLYQVWHTLVVVVPGEPVAIALLYVLVGILLSNPPGKGESLPLWGFALLIGLAHLLGLHLQTGSEGGGLARAIHSGLSLAFAYSLLALLIAGIFGAIHRARQGPDSGRAR